MKKHNEIKTLFSVRLTPEDTARFELICKNREIPKSQAFREWLRTAARSIEAKQDTAA
jgi:hypothetical protein